MEAMDAEKLREIYGLGWKKQSPEIIRAWWGCHLAGGGQMVP
jgi:hypothetical protein